MKKRLQRLSLLLLGVPVLLLAGCGLGAVSEEWNEEAMATVLKQMQERHIPEGNLNVAISDNDENYSKASNGESFKEARPDIEITLSLEERWENSVAQKQTILNAIRIAEINNAERLVISYNYENSDDWDDDEPTIWMDFSKDKSTYESIATYDEIQSVNDLNKKDMILMDNYDTTESFHLNGEAY